MNRKTLRRTRGQAMVEMAIGLMVFVTILIFAIHFAEVGYLSVKVTEAAHSAVFDATGYEHHRWASGDISPATNAVSQAASQAQSRYRDFDSRTTSNMTTTQVFTRAQNMRVDCQLGQGPGYMRDPTNMASYRDNGGVGCQASATINAVNIANNFLDQGGGFFKTQHYVPRTITVCGMGRGSNGACNSRLTMMLDDWGLTGRNEGQDCDVYGCDNEAFFRLARNSYAANAALRPGGHTAAASRWAWQVVSTAPIPPMGESRFFLSAKGSEHQFTQQMDVDSDGHDKWPSSPGSVGRSGAPVHAYHRTYNNRTACFLGLKCPPNR